MKSSLLAAVALLAGLTVAFAETSKAPVVGDKAPLVQGKDQNGNEWKLADAKGKSAVLLYFYPKDNTPGCTKEACGLRDRMEDLKKDNVEIIGVSFDSEASHQKFIADQNLNFTLIADTDGKIADKYGVRILGKNMAHRVSFLIDKHGKIVHITDNPKAEIHLSEMKDAIDNLPKK